ncbi:MAG: NADP(H)-dependent aldo-keto reductase [Rhodospirillaceae bacterium]|nr:NADP(H)-dependent aldo-keto reductase [Rhodospirillaceae bacterium]MCA8934126.1 NADP(H)-dependent aldo-keto reductase [Rhodospirillaceae bacterium]
MRYRRLGRTDLEVSAICLGTMTYGEQNTEEDAFALMDYALDEGVTFFDTAEMYSTPPREQTYGRTEEIIGNWFADRGNRDKVILASKVLGGSSRFPYVRGGSLKLNRRHIEEAVNASLRRLKTDYIDLYQTHWPDRAANMFGQRGFAADADEEMTPLDHTLDVLGDLVKAGKIRHFGVSNETPWGVMRYLELAEQRGLPRAVSIQNPYSLLNRLFEVGLAEIAIREDCGLLAYAPMAGGVLSGKYLGGARPAGARFSLAPHMTRYFGPSAEQATGRYVAVARRHGLTPATLALTFVNTRPFVTSTIVGATTLDQLRADIATIDATLSDAALADIEAVHTAIPDPCP